MTESVEPSASGSFQSLTSEKTSRLDVWLGRAIDAGLLSVIFIAPLMMGGRHPVGRLVFVSLVAFTAVAWAARHSLSTKRRWIGSGAEWVVAAALGLILLQLTPLSAEWIDGLSPTIHEQLVTWSAPGSAEDLGLGHWNRLSLAPTETLSGLFVFCAYAMLFFVVVQHIRTLSDIEKLFRWIALAVGMMAALGLLQYLMGSTRFVWIFQHPSRTASEVIRGSFANENHFAHFLALGIAPLIWWCCDAGRNRSSSSSRHWNKDGNRTATLLSLIGLLGLVAFAGLLTYSRGGVIVMLLAASTSVALFARFKLLGRKSVFGIVAAATVVLSALLIHGFTPLVHQLDKLRVGSLGDLQSSLGRIDLWKAELAGARDYLLTGTGVGTHQEVVPTYLDHTAKVRYTHGENGYLQIFLETGLPGLALLLVALALIAWWCWRAFIQAPSSRQKACAGVVVAGVVASLVHSLADFVWYIPACMSLTLILLACGFRLAQLSGEARQRTWSAPVWSRVLGAASLACACTLMIAELVPAAKGSRSWIEYRTLAAASRQPAVASDVTRTIYDVLDHVSLSTLKKMTAHLEATVRSNPNHARAHMRLVEMYLRHFEHGQRTAKNAIMLSQIRDAAIAAHFANREALVQWMDIALGENRLLLDRALYHTRRSLQLCPLQGEGYLYLAQIGFLECRDERSKLVCIEQALRLRPEDGKILLAAGQEYALQGQNERTIELWRRAFRRDPTTHRPLFELVARNTDERGLQAFVRALEPDRAGKLELFHFLEGIEQPAKASLLAAELVQEIEQEATRQSGARAADMWKEVVSLYDYLKQDTRAIRSARRVLHYAPQDFKTHRWLGRKLFEQEQFDEAVEHIKWCLQRKPNDEYLRGLVAPAYRGRVAGSDRKPQKTLRTGRADAIMDQKR